jgi:uncharacterized protein (TIGR03435 family)
MAECVIRKLNLRNRALQVASIAASLALLFSVSRQNQAQTSQAGAPTQAAFDVASIRLNKEDGSNNTSIHSDHETIKLNFVGTPLIYCVQMAYNVRDYQITGPGWMKSSRYNIAAAGPYHEGDKDVWRTMLQGLLAERFKLQVHHVEKQLPVYSLVVGKKGPTIQKADAGGGSNITGRNGHLTMQRISMAKFAEYLSTRLDRPVIDETGIEGNFNFDLQYSEESLSSNPERANGTAALDTSAPAIFTAVQEQLGLKLKARKAPVDTIAVDHVEAPSEN